LIRELGGLACAPLWAISSILLKSQTGKHEAMHINAVRGIFASIFTVSSLLIFGNTQSFYNLTILTVTYLFLSVIIGMIIGDTLFIKSMDIIGVSKALPISIIYPIFVLPFSIFVVGEKLSPITLGGIFLTAIGIYFITATSKATDQVSVINRKQQSRGILYVIGACLCWAAGTISLKYAITNMDPILAGAIRMPFMTLAVFLIIYFQKGTIKVRSYGLKSLTALGLAGILGIGVGGLLFMVGVKYAGPAKTSILSSTAPFFGVPLSMFMLREKVTMKIIAGTIMCVVGIWLVI
jgi:DME family drug/metabolite transporter